MKIEDVVQQKTAPARVREFFDKDVSGEVFKSSYVAEALTLGVNSVNNCTMSKTCEGYFFVVRVPGGKPVTWWGNPAAIKRLQEVVARNGQS